MTMKVMNFWVFIIKKMRILFLLLLLSTIIYSQNLNLSNTVGFNFQDNSIKTYKFNVSSVNSYEVKHFIFSIRVITRLIVRGGTALLMILLILSPTRELSTQTSKVISSIGSFMNGLKIQTLFGGSSVEEGSSFSSRNVPMENFTGIKTTPAPAKVSSPTTMINQTQTGYKVFPRKWM